MSVPAADDLDALIAELAHQERARRNWCLPDGYRIEHHPRSRVGAWWAVYPHGRYKARRLVDAENWLWMCAIDADHPGTQTRDAPTRKVSK
jgi:hypothetical protein